MKYRVYKPFLLAVVLLCVVAPHARAQAFQNLNFEAANIPPGTQPASMISASAAIPGWTTSQNTWYDAFSGGGALVSVNDSLTPIMNFSPLQGRYSAILFGGAFVPSTSISQMGLVPANAHSIQMDISLLIPSAPFTVSLGGQLITMVPLQVFPNYTVYGGDVSPFAGMIENLTITQFAPAPPNVPPAALELDDIIFSPQIVPE